MIRDYFFPKHINNRLLNYEPYTIVKTKSCLTNVVVPRAEHMSASCLAPMFSFRL